MANTLKLTFITDASERAILSIPSPLTSATDAKIKTAMEAIIASKAVILEGGFLDKPEEASLVTVSETKYDTI